MQRDSKEALDRIPNEAEALATRLKEKDQELNTLRRSMLDMRNALTIEVAEKHDVILNLRRDVQQLEEKYRQANKQTQFKDDIIKEMRKEIKQLKTQINPEKSKSHTPSRFPDGLLEPLPSFHKCCPYVKDLCPVNLKNKEIITYFKRSKDTAKQRIEEKIQNNSASRNAEPRSSLEEKKSSHNITPLVNNDSALHADKQFEINGEITFTSNSHPFRAHKTVGDASSSESIPRNVLPQINFYSQRSIPDSQPQQKPRSTLTTGTILHEYYGMKDKGDIFGVVESYREPQKSVCTPKHVCVKTVVSNLEENAKEKTEIKKDSVKKVSMSGEDNFKFT